MILVKSETSISPLVDIVETCGSEEAGRVEGVDWEDPRVEGDILEGVEGRSVVVSLLESARV